MSKAEYIIRLKYHDENVHVLANRYARVFRGRRAEREEEVEEAYLALAHATMELELLKLQCPEECK